MKTLEMTTDPLEHYGVSRKEIEAICGIIPFWVKNVTYLGLPLYVALNKQYQFGLYNLQGGEVSPDGIFSYPEDPDLYPYCKIIRDDETFYQYPMAICAIVQKDGSTFITRMD